MEDESHLPFTKGLSSKEALVRLVRQGRQTVNGWSNTKDSHGYGCTTGRVLCRNSFVISLTSALFLLVGAATIENQLSFGLLGLSIFHIAFLCFAHYVQWKHFAHSSEIKKHAVLRALDYVEKVSTSPMPYAPLGEPLSDDMFTQTAIRDNKIVAVPRLLLVEGDTLLLRPSQIAPCDCRLESGETLKKGGHIGSKVTVNKFTGATTPLTAVRAVATSTPLVEHLNSVGASRRKSTPLEHQIHYCLHVVGERVILPVLVSISLVACSARFLHDGIQSLFATRFVFAIPSLIILPLVTPTIFFVLLFVQKMGNSAIRNELHASEVNSMKDFVALIGSLTGTSFFDKKGLLSPMNPCLDKVIFFRPTSEEQPKDSLSLEIMDLSSELNYDGSWSVDFDDPNWSRFGSNLKAIGQCLLMNRCDSSFTPFLDHLSAVASTVPRTIATACRRCSCVFPQLIGFEQSSAEQFRKLPQTLGFYQRRPGEAPLPGLTKHQTPLEMAYATVHADDRSLYYHMSCQGTANLVLEACTHVWDGESLIPISERLCKTAADFYQRHSVTGYCLALSYRPSVRPVEDPFKNTYFEVPLLRDRPRIGNLVRTHSLDSSQDDAFFDSAPQKTVEDVIQRYLTGHVLCGMIVTQYEVMPQAVQLVDQLENLCVRFVYFSRENELRSRVFAEKLGLEAGWNCHVSLAEVCENDGRTLKDFFLAKVYGTENINNPADSGYKKNFKSDEQLHLIYSSSYVQGSPSVKKQSQVVPKVVVLPNKAQLPTGIAAVRPHLEQVDNVPLLVSLITDCTSQANLEMLEIMQEYGELVLAIGSSLSVANTNIFLQADVSMSVLPLGDWSCSVNPSRDWQQIKEMVDRLMGTACDFRLAYDRILAIPPLIVACRHRLASVRGSLAFHLFASCMLSTSLLFTAVSFLPLLFDYDQVFLTVFVQLPCLTLGSVFTPFHPTANVIRISSKNSNDVQRQSISWAAVNFLVGFLPTSLYLVMVFFFLLVGNATVACSFADVVCSVASDHLSDVPLSTLSIRHIVGLHQALSLCVLSSAWVYPLSSFWHSNPLACLPWTASCVVCLVAQVLFSYASGVALHKVLSIFSVSGIVVWTFFILIVNELVKLRSIRSFAREQRRTKLGFDTKLGMNSPY
ncbi:hypothetical protein Y032_0293g1617 [Ancylostoma ceylanicum]|uniref:Cation-transporting P-type ATPase C-terminal domain-containing protein n=2 Tax=Ancylostoma ceylanicum TaxID=53326 RepID=A0A016S4V7_9BILA|nr:hypothetical protein Y032_0293g1617 [Ancylostoma ceylanicum]